MTQENPQESPILDIKKSLKSSPLSAESLMDAQAHRMENLDEIPEPPYMEAPLQGLCPTPLHLMSEEEKREWVRKIRALRTSAATFYAELREEGESVETDLEPTVKPKKVKVNESIDLSSFLSE